MKDSPIAPALTVEIKLINGPRNGEFMTTSKHADDLRCNLLVGTSRETGDISHGIIGCAVVEYEWSEKLENGRRLYFFLGDMLPKNPANLS